MRRSIAVLVVAANILAGTTMLSTKTADAWKPPTHLFGTEDALQDAVDGTVVIPRADGLGTTNAPVNPTIQQALQQYPKAYRAGAIGPDAFPDLLFGQSQIHPDTTDGPSPETAQTFEWLDHLWTRAWDPATPEPQRLQNIAFALGYMGGHANGDVWAHTFINEFAGGVFPDFTDLAHSDISVRHLVLEGYVDKHRPGYEDRQTYEIEAPTGFIADELILSDFSRSNASSPIYDFFFNLQDGLETEEASVHQDNVTQDMACADLGLGEVCVPDPTDSPINLVEWGIDLLIEEYLENWIDDITTGLRAWPEVWETIARELMTGKKADATVILDAFKEWGLRHFLSMMGVPDFVGEGLFLIGEITAFITDLITSVLSAVFDAIKAIPIIGDVVEFVEDLYTQAKDFIVGKATKLVDYLAGIFLTLALGFSELNPLTKDAIDKNNDGIITPLEVIRVFQEPEEYMGDPALFPPDARSKIDAAMHLPPGTDNDDGEVFRDYDSSAFAPLYDTRVMASLSMLDEHGLNQFFKGRAGGNTAALSNLYGPNPAGAHVPNNLMLGWAKSIDAEYQWRVNSPNDNQSYGTGALKLWEDCVSRDRVWRPTFKNPVDRLDGFTDIGDPPTGLSDSQAPVTSVTLNGPNITNGGTTYVSGSTEILLSSSDNYFAKEDLRVSHREFPTGGPVPAYGPAVPADPAPFTLAGDDGPKTVQFYAHDDKGRCNKEGDKTQLYSLDNTPPVITVTSPTPPGPADYLSDVFLPLTFTADDGTGSGVDPATYAHSADGVDQPGAPNGQIDLFDYPAGLHDYEARAADLLGNPGTAQVPWRTTVSHTSLQNNLLKAFAERGCVRDAATHHSLNVKLVNAEAADARGQDGSSDRQLQAFKDEMALRTGDLAEPGKAITGYCANVLTINATALQAA